MLERGTRTWILIGDEICVGSSAAWCSIPMISGLTSNEKMMHCEIIGKLIRHQNKCQEKIHRAQRYQLGLHSNFLPKSWNFKKSKTLYAGPFLIFWNPSLHNGWVYNLVGNRQPSSSYALYHLYVLWFHTLATLGDLCHVTDWCSFFSFQAFTISLCSSHENSKSPPKCLIVLLGGNLSIHLTSDFSVWNSPIPQK